MEASQLPTSDDQVDELGSPSSVDRESAGFPDPGDASSNRGEGGGTRPGSEMGRRTTRRVVVFVVVLAGGLAVLYAIGQRPRLEARTGLEKVACRSCISSCSFKSALCNDETHFRE